MILIYDVVSLVEGSSGYTRNHQGVFTDRKMAGKAVRVFREATHGKVIVVKRMVNCHTYFIMKGMKSFLIETRDAETPRLMRMSPWDKVPDEEVVLVSSNSFWTREAGSDKMIRGNSIIWSVWAYDEADAIRKITEEVQ